METTQLERGFPPPPPGLTWRVDAITDLLEYLNHLCNVADSEWASLVTVSPMFFFDVSPKRYPIGILPFPVTVLGELVRIGVDLDKIIDSLAFLKPSFLDQLKPLFVSLGEVRLDKETETLVILRVILGNKKSRVIGLLPLRPSLLHNMTLPVTDKIQRRALVHGQARDAEGLIAV
jgi:hypothetical protein